MPQDDLYKYNAGTWQIYSWLVFEQNINDDDDDKLVLITSGPHSVDKLQAWTFIRTSWSCKGEYST